MLVNQKELSNVLGITSRRIRQLREEGLEILRSNYSEELKKLS